MKTITALIALLFIFDAIMAQYTITIDDVSYDAESCTISRYKWPAEGKKSIIIPSSFGNKPIKCIGTLCFYNPEFQNDKITGLTEVTIAKGIETIGMDAFWNNQIEKLSLPDGLRRINRYAFHNCCNIETLVIPNTVELIDTGAFTYCGIKHLTLPNTINVITNMSFCGNKLQEISIPNTVTSIEDDAFKGNKIEKIDIPASVEKIYIYKQYL